MPLSLFAVSNREWWWWPCGVLLPISNSPSSLFQIYSNLILESGAEGRERTATATAVSMAPVKIELMPSGGRK
ncbi:hypothetical protein DY000_02021249 [Brassica cretica]|uniref:Uncharacterized protein n=1 Tax=Brassica cretica TaxID=69181 RepID=A0ABQ7EE16_BRACR|nr:hypothetical protein DY000_02021249 [Brassica cretica]